MTRFAFGAKWSAGSAPAGLAEGIIAASAPRRSRRKRAPSAMAPSPVVLRVRKARRVSVFSISVWKIISVPMELARSLRDRLVQIEQDICHGGHRRQLGLVHRFGRL